MMDGQTIGFVALGVLMCFNLTAVAYSYGKLTQSVKDISRRVGKLEAIQGCKPDEKD